MYNVHNAITTISKNPTQKYFTPRFGVWISKTTNIFLIYEKVFTMVIDYLADVSKYILLRVYVIWRTISLSRDIWYIFWIKTRQTIFPMRMLYFLYFLLHWLYFAVILWYYQRSLSININNKSYQLQRCLYSPKSYQKHNQTERKQTLRQMLTFAFCLNMLRFFRTCNSHNNNN